MKNYKGFGSMSEDEFIAKRRQLKISYFVQCLDLTNEFNRSPMSDEVRDNMRGMISEFVYSDPKATFDDFCVSLGKLMVRIGAISQKQFDDITS